MKFNKPHIYFWTIALIIFVIALFYYNSDITLDINVHDTYIVIAYFHLMILLSIFLAFIGLVYYLHYKFNVKLSRGLSKIHLVGTTGIFIVSMLGFTYFKLKPSNPNFPLFDDMSNEILLHSLSFLVFSVLQIIFIINSIFSTISHLLKRINS